MHLEIRHLRLVAAIADSGGMTRAARALHLTQSALSHQLRDIEARLGVALFLRVNNRLVMTQAGERLLASARRVLGEVETAERDLTAGDYAGGAGLIRLCTECYTAYHWFPAAIAAFREAWPRVELRIVPDATSRPHDALLEGSIDVALVHNERDHHRLGYTPLFDDELVLVTPPGHRLAAKRYVTARDFEAEHLIIYSTPHSESTIITAVLRPASVEPRVLTRLQLTEAILELVKAGLGVSVLASWAVAPLVAEGKVATVSIGPRGLRRQWMAARRTDDAEPRYLGEFVSVLARNVFAAGSAVALRA